MTELDEKARAVRADYVAGVCARWYRPSDDDDVAHFVFVFDKWFDEVVEAAEQRGRAQEARKHFEPACDRAANEYVASTDYDGSVDAVARKQAFIAGANTHGAADLAELLAAFTAGAEHARSRR